MIGKLIERPIAVTMSIIAILILGAVSIGMLPVSLMPNVDIPQITVQVTLNGASAREVDQSVIKPLRRQLIQISSLKDLRCEANNGSGILFMQFEHGSDLDFNFIEVNEKIDRILSSLPKEMERPKVIKASATDIPVFFVDITADDPSLEGFMSLSKFAKEVVAKRIEQIPAVALVDVSGLQGSRLLVTPDAGKLRSLGVSVSELENAISRNNLKLGNLTIKDGYYQWSVRFESEIRSKEDIEQIRLKINDRIYLFKELATVEEEPAPVKGMVRSAGKRAVTFAVIKQADARMSDLQRELDGMMDNFRKEYSGVHFSVSRNQTELLDYSIENLRDNIVIGAILAVLVIFFFLQDFKSPFLVMITIPLSLVVSLLALFVLGISINIISLSGLILGIGMMVDNSIIVIDNITQIWNRGAPLKRAVERGTVEVIGPMLSSVLTTCSVFLPLIFLSGITGALFYDQAMAVTVGLFSSLLVAVLVIPVYYYLLYSRGGKKESAFLKKIQRVDYEAWYENTLKWVFRHARLVWIVLLLILPVTYWIYTQIDKSKLPPLTHDEIILNVDWNEALTIEENDARSAGLLEGLDNRLLYSNVLSGSQDFLLSHTGMIERGQSMIYLKAVSPEILDSLEMVLGGRLKDRYPEATFSFAAATNIFNLIFSEDEPDLIAMIRNREGAVPEPDELNEFLAAVKERLPSLYVEPVLWQEQILFIPDREKMTLYNLSYSQIYSVLSQATRENTLFSVNEGTFSVPIVFGDEEERLNLLALQVKNSEGADVPLYSVLKERRIRDLKSIVSGKDGDYYPLNISADDKEIPEIIAALSGLARESDRFDLTFAGAYFSSREMIRELIIVLVVALLLLFFILAAQFESVVQPLIILSEIFVDLFGAMAVLWFFGAGINLMSLIGIVVMCGIVINDSILKVDTINRLRREEGYSLLRAIMTGGSRRLKPIIMTSLTTILAIAPFLVRGDMGSDLQFPLSLALIGGMVFGTLVSIFCIPLFYYEIYRRSDLKKRNRL